MSTPNSSVLIQKPDGRTALFDLSDVLMAEYDPAEGTLKLEFKNRSTSVLSGGKWVEQLWDILKRRAGFSASEDRSRSAFSQDLSVKYSGKLPSDPPLAEELSGTEAPE